MDSLSTLERAPVAPAPAAPTALTPAELEANAKVNAPVAPAPKEGEAPRVVARLVTEKEAKTERVERDRSSFRLYVAGSVAVDNPAVAGTLAAPVEIVRERRPGRRGIV